MKKPLLTQFIHSHLLWRARIFTTLCSFLLILLMGSTVSAQNVSRQECMCLNNQTTQGNGQFAEIINITGPSGATWSVVSVNGLYAAASPAPPAAPLAIAPGTVITEVSTGTYRLDAKRIDGTTWNLVVTNGTINVPISSAHLCKYPRLQIFGDFGTCLGGAESYNVAIPLSVLRNPVWTVTNGTLTTGNLGTSIGVQWPFVVSSGTVAFNAQANAFVGQTAGFCDVNLSKAVEIVDENNVTMACNNLLNLSLGNICELTVDPYMILEDPEYPITSYDVVLRDIQSDTIIPGGRVNQAYIGKTLEVRVVHECTGNSCWGYVKLDDKSIPPLICGSDVTINCDQLTGPEVTGYPLPATATVTPLGNKKFLVRDFDLCSDVTLEYQDQIAVAYCDGDFSSIIERTWLATDISGNKTNCSNYIFVRKASLVDIDFPGNFDDVLGPNPSIDACANFPLDDNGNPDPSYTGEPTGIFCLNVTVDYTDIRIPICRGDNTYKIIRKWVVTDLCTQTQLTSTQTIAVMDTKAPVVVAPNDFEVSTTGITCASNIPVPKPIIVYECSNYKYYVSFKVPDPAGVPTGEGSTDGVVYNAATDTYTLTQVPSGVNRLWIKYKVVDDCDNASEVFTEVDILDGTPPVPVCNQFTFVGLNEQGIGWAGVDAIDDGSWDNCALDRLEVRRMETSSCGITNSFGSKVMFCCADVGKQIMVQLKAIDKGGNENTCMVEVTVQDNLPPVLTNCPKDITVSCEANLTSLIQYGVPTVTDICGATLTESKSENYNTCGTGILVRTFLATDNFGNTSTCVQNITVQPTTPFGLSNITWPTDHTVTNGCLDTATEPDALPNGKKRPTWTIKACSQVTATYDDVVFQYVDGACFKILRKWTVIDWCQFNPFVPTIGKWERTQVIKVQNNVAPTITKGCNDADITMTSIDNCKANVIITADGTDDCTPTDELEWKYALDINNDGTNDINNNGKTINRTMDFGTHKITWTVTDQCGNSKTCSKVFVVKDTKDPTPYCLTEIVTVILETDGTAVIWASDFDKGSYDNCSSTSSLKFSFSTNINDSFRTYTCDSLSSSNTLFQLRIYVTDSQGNQDYCTTSIRIQDNNNLCGLDNNNGENTSGNRVAIGGKITNEVAEEIKEVSVSLVADADEFPMNVVNSDLGLYQFNDLDQSMDYIIHPTKSGSYLEGISTLDLVLIQRHILGVKKFDSPYKTIAADVTNDKKITSSDLVTLRKLILGLESSLTKVPVWRFVNSAQQFVDIHNPYPFEENIIVSNMEGDMMYNNFTAVKMGDVNLSASLQNENNAENRSKVELNFQSTAIQAGQSFKISISAAEYANLTGFQMALTFDTEKASFAGIDANAIKIDEYNLGLSDINNGTIAMSWINDQSVIKDAKLFDLLFTAKQDLNTATFIGLNDVHLKPEVYLSDGGQITTAELRLAAEGKSDINTFELYQNSPNPFNENTIIGFNLPTASDATMKVYDVQGKLLIEKSGSFAKGYNHFELNAKEIGTTGILYYQVETKQHSSNKMMIVIN